MNKKMNRRTDAIRGQEFVEKLGQAKRKRKQKRDNERELNLFYDTSYLESKISEQQKLRTLIVIGQSEIISLQALAGLKNLKELWLVECGLKDITLLRNIVSLEKLFLYSNEIPEIPDLSNLKNLTIISLARNKISDLRGIGELTALKDLNVADNEIQKIDNIFSSKFELSHINLSGNKICDLQDVENLLLLENLKMIEFGDPVYGKCPLIESHFNYRQYLIRRLPSLQEIDYYSISHEERENSHSNEVSFNEKMLQKYSNDASLDLRLFTKILSSKEFLHIKHLKIGSCSITEANLRDIFLPHLESLDLSKNRIKSVRGLKGMRELRTLCLSHNQLGVVHEKNVEDTFPLEIAEFPNLIILYLDNNGIRSIKDADIPKTPSLKCIFLQDNEIQDIDGIQDFPRLDTVVLDNNEIKNIFENKFRYNIELRTLFLENNELTSLKFAEELRNVERLFVANNKIMDRKQLNHLSCLLNLEEITILGNPFCKKCNHYQELCEILEAIKMIDGHAIFQNKSRQLFQRV